MLGRYLRKRVPSIQTSFELSKNLKYVKGYCSVWSRQLVGGIFCSQSSSNAIKNTKSCYWLSSVILSTNCYWRLNVFSILRLNIIIDIYLHEIGSGSRLWWYLLEFLILIDITDDVSHVVFLMRWEETVRTIFYWTFSTQKLSCGDSLHDLRLLLADDCLPLVGQKRILIAGYRCIGQDQGKRLDLDFRGHKLKLNT